MYYHTHLQDGSTALMFAAQSGHIEIVRLLLTHPHVEHSIKDNLSVCVCELPHQEAIEVIKQTPRFVQIVVCRTVRKAVIVGRKLLKITIK